jgi:hypothetical protein
MLAGESKSYGILHISTGNKGLKVGLGCMRYLNRDVQSRAKEVIIGVLPEALRGDGQDGELRAVVPRLVLFGVSTNKSNL